MHGVQHVREGRIGLDIARNAGLRHTSGDIVAYLDDDVTVPPDWMAGLLRG